MATIKIQRGAVCAGGGHVIVYELTDDVITATHILAVNSLINRPGKGANDKQEAVRRILEESEGPNLNSFFGQAESKRITIPDVQTESMNLSGGQK